MFWDNFKKVCDSMGLKPTPVLKEAGISTGSIGRWQAGSSPNADAVIALSEYLKCSTDLLLTGHEYSATEQFQITGEERNFLSMFRSLPDAYREFIFGSVEAAYNKELEQQEAEKRLLG